MRELVQFTMGTGYRKTGFYVRGTGHFVIRTKRKVKYADYPEIFWCISGCGAVHGKDATALLKPGWVWYFPPGTIHDIDPSPVLDYRWLSLDGPEAGRLFDSLQIAPGLTQAGRCPEELFARIDLELQEGSRQSQMRALAAAFEILTLAVAPSGDARPVVEQARDLMREHYARTDLSVESISGLLNVHRVTLSRSFKEVYGISPGEYLNNIRLQRAMSLLRDSRMPVKEVAAACGFTSAGYFSKVLRRCTGQTPLSFRDKHI